MRCHLQYQQCGAHPAASFCRENASFLNHSREKVTVGQLEMAPGQHTNAADIRGTCPELKHLPALLRRRVHDEAAEERQAEQPVCAHEKLQLVQSGVVCARVPWIPADVLLHPVHATPSYYGSPWYDTVAVYTGEGDEWYAELRCLFRFRGEQYALVRWYDEVHRQNDVLVKHGCKPIVWWVRNGQPAYEVVELKMIKRRVYVVPDFACPGFFYLSAFKWDRLPPLLIAPGSGQGESA